MTQPVIIITIPCKPQVKWNIHCGRFCVQEDKVEPQPSDEENVCAPMTDVILVYKLKKQKKPSNDTLPNLSQ